MNFRFYLTTIIFFVIISCNDDEVVKKGSDKFIDFEVSDIRKFEYKGALINSVNDENFKNIGVFGYNTTKNFDETTKPESSFLPNIEINKNDNDWVIDKKYYWPGEGSVSFFAYSPYGGENIEILDLQENAPVLKYTVNPDVTKQSDLLIAVSQKDISRETVSFTFDHALASISFYVNGFGQKVDSVYIMGVADNGTLSLDYDGKDVIWKDISNINDTIYIAGLIENVVSTEESTNITSDNGYLMMIPQALSNDAKMIVIFEGMDPKVVQLNTVGVTEWKAGVNYIYNLMEGEYFFEFGEVNVECPYSGGEFKFDMASEYYSQNGTYTDVGWSVEIISSIVDGVDMTSDSTSTIWITGINDINDKNEINLSKTLQVAPSTYTSTNDLDQGLQQATVVSHADMINLAKVGDVYSTANCYVVNAPGWYMFPCFVKGNGIENNPNPVINNNKSVPASQTTTKSRLFMKSTDYTDIVKIETNDAYPELVWQDAPGLISDIEFNSTKEYIQFYISPETIRSGNAIIAICDTKTGNIIWSWHIWVTFWNLEELGGSLNNTQSDTIFYGHNIGTCMAATYSYVKRSVTLRFTQNVSNKTYDMTFTQRDTSFSIGHNAPYYQWGRKDPMLASDGSNNSKSCFGPKPFTIEKIQSPVSVETANQTPYVFYCNVSNWNSDSNVNLWLGSDSISKSMYDPSPVGYMMATKDILGLLQSGKWISEDNYNAYLFEYNGGTVALYANGMRNGTDGTIENNQNIGYYWCNTFYVTDVSDRGYWYMTISNTGNDFYNIGTTSGYSIRSVRQ